jgi:HTH-type transcriptional regulator, transcriptional repressor of NAD biosynthesis genes
MDILVVLEAFDAHAAWTGYDCMNRFAQGLVVGKFCPLHRGHEYLISTALTQCEQLWIISYTRPEFDGLSPAMRQVWLTERFPHTHILVLDQHRLDSLCQEKDTTPREIPVNDASDDVHRLFLAWLCINVMRTTVDAVFSSESYGPGFAAVLSDQFTRHHNKDCSVVHVSVDPERKQWPVSGTTLRQSQYTGAHFLSPTVWADMQLRIAILGGESSGKTTLAQALAEHLGCNWVPEYGRTLWDYQGGELQYADMLKIAQEQVKQERQLVRAGQFLICDTTPLVTEFYSQEMFGKVDPWLRVLSHRAYAQVFLCANDFDFVQDGTRRDAKFRQLQHDWYAVELRKRKMSYATLSGSLSARVRAAISTIEKLV